MKQLVKRVVTIVTVLTLVVYGSIIATGVLNTNVDASESSKSTINVTGKGAIQVAPDMAYVTLGVRTENKDPKVAQEENSKKMNQVIDALKKLGIDQKDIKTSNFNIYPEYIYDKNDYSVRSIDRYVVNHNLEITVRDITKVGNIIDTGVKFGVNMANSIRFTISNPDEVYQQALVEAIKNAEGKAKTIASTLSVKVSKPKSVTEQGSYNIPIAYSSYDKVAMERAEMSVPMPVETGELEIVAHINVVYEY
ncbi:hypothetical protein EDC18_101397 [Natranaerovirga pectinivora]|uniref:SIMPL domain-containing protein n=1 Tax=Natranaerovirga pectinivora TaxID=682400 RepID=A0A4R3MTQ8_9FIRM|nr:SIMPL domain-containing protein [Natranaerovirga pectinivora]TCT17100.1 hypothetical protein EDC18_101397 [Natranaerovirga pectinivora]